MSRAAALWTKLAEDVLARLALGEPFYGRSASLNSPHQAIGRDVWRSLVITDWESGTAETEDGSAKFVSLHAPFSTKTAVKKGRPSAQADVIKAIKQLRPDGDYTDHAELSLAITKLLNRKKQLPQSSLQNALNAIKDKGSQ
jgi:hypothetical protein